MSSPPRRFNRYAIAAVVCGILWPFGVPALLLGYEARMKIDESAGAQRGSALATAAIVLGWAQTVFFGLLAAYIVLTVAYVVLSGQPLLG